MTSLAAVAEELDEVVPADAIEAVAQQLLHMPKDGTTSRLPHVKKQGSALLKSNRLSLAKSSQNHLLLGF